MDHRAVRPKVCRDQRRQIVAEMRPDVASYGEDQASKLLQAGHKGHLSGSVCDACVTLMLVLIARAPSTSDVTAGCDSLGAGGHDRSSAIGTNWRMHFPLSIMTFEDGRTCGVPLVNAVGRGHPWTIAPKLPGLSRPTTASIAPIGPSLRADTPLTLSSGGPRPAALHQRADHARGGNRDLSAAVAPARALRRGDAGVVQGDAALPRRRRRQGALHHRRRRLGRGGQVDLHPRDVARCCQRWPNTPRVDARHHRRLPVPPTPCSSARG